MGLVACFRTVHQERKHDGWGGGGVELVVLTLLLAYSLTHFSKKFVLPWREIVSIHGKELVTF
jgi:hypothetical protein